MKGKYFIFHQDNKAPNGTLTLIRNSAVCLSADNRHSSLTCIKNNYTQQAHKIQVKIAL